MVARGFSSHGRNGGVVDEAKAAFRA